jgi:phosphoribosylformimino-5-aminoimidazole carboxamide ribotide isomerase
MNLYPAIDILGGQAVRLVEGKRENATVYGTPIEMARRWAAAGARWLHVVDLDGAFAGRPVNVETIREIRRSFPELKIEVGGGLRDVEAVRALVDAGVDRAILGTVAVTDPDLVDAVVERFGEKVAVGIDARDGTVRLSGWTSEAGLSAAELARRVEDAGVGLVIYTDISRDGRLEGVNVDATRALLDSTGLRVIASGGVASPKDVVRLNDLRHPRLEGVIIGKALYEGRIDLAEMVAAVEGR